MIKADPSADSSKAFTVNRVVSIVDVWRFISLEMIPAAQCALHTFETKGFNTHRLHFPKLEFALEYLNNKFLHAGNINHVLHKTTIANKLNHAETRTSV